jgi:hypothetical protein
MTAPLPPRDASPTCSPPGIGPAMSPGPRLPSRDRRADRALRQEPRKNLRSTTDAGKLKVEARVRRMNWKRGLLRLWVVVSALWLVGSGAMLWNALFQRPHEFEVTAPDGRSFTVIAYGTVASDEVVEWTKEQITAGLSPPPKGFRLVYNQPLPLRDRESLFAIVLLPPLAGLILGGAGWWVLSGFRKRPAKP